MKFAGKTKGFTIVEMLTVMGIIAILIGLLVPALNQVKDYSKQIQQKAQFHSIDVAMEMFKNNFGAYPDSFDNLGLSTIAPVAPLVKDTFNYCGTEKLAEALAGYDLLGVHPKSGFRSDGTNYFPPNPSFTWAGGYKLVYDTVNGIQVGVGAPDTEKSGDENIKARKKYIDMENANAFRMQDVYTAAQTTAGNFNPKNYVLCDVYSRSRTSGTKTGMPILYFKARTIYTLQNYSDTQKNMDDIYDYDDNQKLVLMGTAEATPAMHEIEKNATGAAATLTEAYLNFQKLILNQQILQNGVYRPYRADSYIMISAGKDGVYGTSDDIYNFERKAE
jgi:prepilin-type N-terminal cleavage/methylation domain-containing protein